MGNKVSVIVPVYNVEQYLKQCIESLIGQTYSNCEFIFVNDGSPDNSLAIIQKYEKKDRRICVINQANTGLSGARNRGLAEATGEYVVFQDSDDWLDPEAIDTAVRFAQEKSLDIVLWSYISEYKDKAIPRPLFGSKRIVWEEAKQVHRRIVGLLGEELREPHKADSCVTAWGKLYRREVIKDIRFVDTKKIGTEDALFNTYVFGNAKQVGYLPNLFSHYRKTNDASLTSGYKANLASCWGTLYQMMQSYLDETSAEPDFYSALHNRICLSMIGIGLNELRNPKGFFQKTHNLRQVLNTPLWKKAYGQLEFRYFPLKWKVFFWLCKWKQTEVLILLLYAMNALKRILAN